MKAYTPQTFDHLKGLDGISDAQLAEHFKLYEGYVKQVNSLNEQLDEMVRKGKPSGTDPHFAELTRHLGFEYNGMILHEYYFSNLKRAADPMPSKGSGLTQALEQNFGGIDRWKADFQAVGGMRGVGWAVLFQDPVTERLVNQWISLHQDGAPAGFKPLLVMDVWEHAFMVDYKPAERERYIEAFFANMAWDVIEQRLISPAAERPAAAA